MTPFEFVTANEARWTELEKLSSRNDREVDPERFLALYRTCCEHLALAEARGFPSHVLDRLSLITSRAHQIVYRQSEFGWFRIQRVFTRDFPAAVRDHAGYMAASALLLFLPAIIVGFATYLQPGLVLSVVDPVTASAFDQMYSSDAESIGRWREASSDWAMFGFYIMNNVGIAFQCFVTGVAFGVGSVLFLVFNGLYVGVIAGYVTARGHGLTFFSFVATHSAFELTAIVISGAAGLTLGRSVLLPGRLPRIASLQMAARASSPMIFGAAVMLVIAAVIEAFWSSASWVSPAAKFSFAAVCWLLVGAFLARRNDAA